MLPTHILVFLMEKLTMLIMLDMLKENIIFILHLQLVVILFCMIMRCVQIKSTMFRKDAVPVSL